MSTATRTRKPVTKLSLVDTDTDTDENNGAPGYQIDIWNGGDWTNFTVQTDDPDALASELNKNTARTVILDEFGAMVAVFIGPVENPVEYPLISTDVENDVD